MDNKTAVQILNDLWHLSKDGKFSLKEHGLIGEAVSLAVKYLEEGNKDNEKINEESPS